MIHSIVIYGFPEKLFLNDIRVTAIYMASVSDICHWIDMVEACENKAQMVRAFGGTWKMMVLVVMVTLLPWYSSTSTIIYMFGPFVRSFVGLNKIDRGVLKSDEPRSVWEREKGAGREEPIPLQWIAPKYVNCTPNAQKLPNV